MNVGLFTDTYYPQINGVATSVLMLKENLENLGHNVYVFTTTDPKADKNERNVFRVRSLPFKSSRRVGIMYNRHLARQIKRLNLDIIHTNTEFPLGIFGRTMSRILNIPLVHTYHTIYEDYTHYIVKFGVLDTIAKSAARRLSSNFCNSADKVIVPTSKVKDLLLGYNVEKEIEVIPTGINLIKYSKNKYTKENILSLRNSLNIKEKDKVILYLGRLSDEKNIDEILIAMQSYLKDKNDTKFVLVGNGPYKSNLEDLSYKLGIAHKTIFTGEIPWDNIGLYYQIGDVFVSASQSETQGLTYIEALASGLPVVAKADRCLEGVIQQDINGYAYNTIDEFYAYLDTILNDNFKKESLSQGAVLSSEEFSAFYFALKIEKQYNNMLKTRKRYKRASWKIYIKKQ